MHGQKIHSYTTSNTYKQYPFRAFVTNFVGYYGAVAPASTLKAKATSL
jgi:hypothetical protein